MEQRVKVTLNGSYGYLERGQTRKYYGPGTDIPVPIGLARSLGLAYTELDKPAATPDSTPLPDDFPGKVHLEAAGYTTYEQVSGLSLEDLVALKGIGKATAKAIHAALDDSFNQLKESWGTGQEMTGVEVEVGQEGVLDE